jgi:acyl carrier protein
MTREEIRSTLLAALGDVAPEADLARLDAREDLREQLEIDSMDLLNFAIAVHERTGVEIPESDYPKLASLESAVAYLAARLAAGERR